MKINTFLKITILHCFILNSFLSAQDFCAYVATEGGDVWSGKIYVCSADGTWNYHYITSIVLTWSPVEGAIQYNFGDVTGWWGSGWVPGTSTKIVLSGIDAWHHNYRIVEGMC